MCTVTYLPLGEKDFILTSNRDENPLRKTIPPKTYLEDGVKIKYPKDKMAGGTWIGVSDKERLVCLLNGGFTKHKRNDSYRLSRGIIVKKILASENAIEFIEAYNFYEIEPFTIILVDWSNLLVTYELVWDGTTKHFNKLEQKPHIWSSSTLYTDETKKLREIWFSDWLKNQDSIEQEKILEFHQNETRGTQETSLKMKRDFVETVSITTVEKSGANTSVRYLDLLS